MRIIAGTYKGRRFSPPRGFRARPTTDFAREALFNLLANRVALNRANTLDLFAGSGGISLELASRGCGHVTAVEINPRYCSHIGKLTDELQANSISVVKANALLYLDKTRHSYDVIVADPPYDMDVHDELLQKIFGRGLLSPDGLFVLEHDGKKAFGTHPRHIETRKYGKVHFSLFAGSEM